MRGGAEPSKELSLDKFKIGIEKILDVLDIKELNTQGLGEPFLCSNILEIVEFVKSKGLVIWFVTNGTLIDDLAAKRLVEIGVDKIRISIDSADPQLYAKIKSGSALKQVIANISKLNFYKDRFKKDNPRIAFNSVVLKDTFLGLEDLVKLAGNMRVEEITLIPLVNFSKGMAVEEQQIDFYNKSFQQRFEILKNKAQEQKIELNLGVSLETKEVKYCHSGIYINVEGIVYPCCNISRMNFGNIYYDDIKQIVDNYLKFQKWLADKQIICKECNRILDSGQ